MSRKQGRRERPQGNRQTYAVVKFKGYVTEMVKNLLPEEYEKNIQAGMNPPKKEFRVMASGLTRVQAYYKAFRISKEMYLAQVMVLPEPCSEQDVIDRLSKLMAMRGTKELAKSQQKIRAIAKTVDKDEDLPHIPGGFFFA